VISKPVIFFVCLVWALAMKWLLNATPAETLLLFMSLRIWIDIDMPPRQIGVDHAERS
jgi:hypothetical protein